MEILNNSKNSTQRKLINELPIIAIDFIDKLWEETRDCNETQIHSTSDVSPFIESNSNGGEG